MFTDIKNSRNTSQSNCNDMCDHHQRCHQKRKSIKKLWQPLKRLVTLKSITTSNKNHNNYFCNKNGINNSATYNSIPNNINLNNGVISSSSTAATTDTTTTTTFIRRRLELDSPLEVEVSSNETIDIETLPVVATESEIANPTISHHITSVEDNSKLPLDDRLIQHTQEDILHKQQHVRLTPTKSTEPLIQSASIEKQTLEICTNCIYGKNCLHTNSNMKKYDMDSCLLPQFSTLTVIDPEIEHLREWLRQNSWHMFKNMP